MTLGSPARARRCKPALESAGSASGDAETNSQKHRSHHLQPASRAPMALSHASKDPVVMWPVLG